MAKVQLALALGLFHSRKLKVFLSAAKRLSEKQRNGDHIDPEVKP